MTPDLDKIAAARKWTKMAVHRSGDTRTLMVEQDGVERMAATWCETDFPSCCGIMISRASRLPGVVQGVGLGTALTALREENARRAGKSFVMATTIESNAAERRILEKREWKELGRFKNARTGNTVLIYGKELK